VRDQYPPYPTLTSVSGDKLTLAELMALYDQLTGVGLHPLPKLAAKKQPVPELWAGVKRLPVDRAEAERLQTDRSASGWFIVPSLETDVNLLIIDLDVSSLTDPEVLYHRLQAMSLTRFVLYSPAGGLHLYYRLPDDAEPPNSVHPQPEYPGLELRSRSLGNGIVTMGSYATYRAGAAEKKGVPDGHTGAYAKAPYGEYDEIPEITPALLQWLKEGDKKVVVKNLDDYVPVEHTQDEVMDMLRCILEQWTDHEDYDTWLKLWMAAHDASKGDLEVLDFIIDHPNVHFSNGQDGIDKIRRDWETHVRKAGGTTERSLAYLARQAGYQTTSQADVEQWDIEISTERISSWIETADTLPVHCLVKSQTGSGKTYGIRALWLRLGQPKTVVFVPSVKLALDMASLLSGLGLPAVAYRDEIDFIPTSEMVSAKVLVTTLQTFANRLFLRGQGVMKSYGLVYIEECDQLIQGFAKAMGDGGSHVTQAQAETGFWALQEAFEHSGAVWGVDATMTQISVQAFRHLSQGQTQTVRNSYVTVKPGVVMLETKHDAYAKIAEALVAGMSVVVPCDTAAEVEVVSLAMLNQGYVTPDETLVVNRRSGDTDPRVLAFARDANAAAPHYRLVCYNSAMASGVSVTSFTPDLVVQIASGYLTPRTQLQLLNRYRKQQAVYCWYGGGKGSIEVPDVERQLEAAKARALIEGGYLDLPDLERSDLASLRDRLRAMAAVDDRDQRLNPGQFYRRLLSEDGRLTRDAPTLITPAAIEKAEKWAKAERKEMRELLAATWRDTPPAKERKDMPADYTPIQVLQALVHQFISEVLNGNVPLDVDQKRIYEVVRALYKRKFALQSFVHQYRAMRTSEQALSDRERGLLSHSPLIGRVVLAAMLRHLFEDAADEVTTEKLSGRAMGFTRLIEDNLLLYRAVITAPHRQPEVLRATLDLEHYAIALAKNIARPLGLKIAMRRGGGLVISNLTEVLEFLSWVENAPVTLEFSSQEIEAERLERLAIMRGVDITAVMPKLKSVPLQTAVNISKF
jgi:peptidyl-tRNA hydrolase